MRAHGVPWAKIAARFGKGKSRTCHMHLIRMQEKATAENWTAERDNALKEAYQKKRLSYGRCWRMKWTVKPVGKSSNSAFSILGGRDSAEHKVKYKNVTCIT
jgi:hypothetical protein